MLGACSVHGGLVAGWQLRETGGQVSRSRPGPGWL